MGKSFNIGMKSIVLITVGIIALVVTFIFITENQKQVENGDITFDISPPGMGSSTIVSSIISSLTTDRFFFVS